MPSEPEPPISKLAPASIAVLPVYVLLPDSVWVPAATVNPPLPLISPEKLPEAALLRVKLLEPKATEPEPESPPSATGPPALLRFKAPLAATWLVTGPATSVL